MAKSKSTKSSASGLPPGAQPKPEEPAAEREASLPGAEQHASTPPAPPAPSPPPAPAVKPAQGYVVAAGKSLSCQKGILAEGAPVRPEDVAGGQETLDHLLSQGFLERA